MAADFNQEAHSQVRSSAVRRETAPYDPLRPLSILATTMMDTRLPIDAQDVATAVGDEGARRIMAACVAQACSAKEISHRTRIPLTTVYRLIHRLGSLHVLVVERSAMTPDGRKYDLYRSRVRAAHLDVDEEGDHVRWEPNEAIEERLVRPRDLFVVPRTRLA